MLEKKAIEGKGKWILMKYDIDKIPQLTNALKVY
jgi:thioredoxin-like negative regulator of GroEL